MNASKVFLATALVLTWMLPAGLSLGQSSYPSKPIVLIVPYAAGGVTDIVARVVGARMSEEIGQQIVVENRAGAGGSTGTARAKIAPADGYTLLVGNAGTHSTSPIVIPNGGYDPINDFTFISPLGSYSFVLLCNPSVPAKNVAELIQYSKANPSKLKYGTAGIGSNVNFIFEYFKQRTGANFTHVPYNGAGPMTTALLAGEVSCTFDGTSREQIASGALRAFGIASIEPDSLYPNVPTLDAEGIKGFDLPGWQSIMAPKGVDPQIVARLNKAANIATNDKSVIERLQQLGFNPKGGTPEQLKQIVEKDVSVFRAVARDAKMTFN